MRNRATLLWTGCIRGGMPCSVSLCTWIPLPSRRSVLFQGMRNRVTLLWTGCIREGEALFCIFIYLDTPTLTQVFSISGYEKQGDTALDRLHKRRGSPVLYLYLPGYPYPRRSVLFQGMRNRATLLWTGCIRGGMPCSVSLCTWIPLPSHRSVLFQGMRNRATLLWTGCIRGGMPCSVSLCTWIPLPSRRSVLFQGMRNRVTLLWTGCIREGEALFSIFMYLDTPTLTQVCSISGYEKQGDTALDRLHKRRGSPVLYLYVPGYPYPHAGLYYFRI